MSKDEYLDYCPSYAISINPRQRGFFSKSPSKNECRSQVRLTKKILKIILARNIREVRKLEGHENYLPHYDEAEEEMKNKTNYEKFIMKKNKIQENIEEYIKNVKKYGSDVDNIVDRVNIQKDLRKLLKIVEKIEDDCNVKRSDFEKMEKKAFVKKKKSHIEEAKNLKSELNILEAHYNNAITELDKLKESLLNATNIKSKTKPIKMTVVKGSLLASLDKELAKKTTEELIKKQDESKREDTDENKTDSIDENYEKFLKETKFMDQKIDKGLDQLKNVVGRLHEQAQLISTELDTQNEMLDSVEKKIDKHNNVLHRFRLRLKKLNKNIHPVNAFCKIIALAFIAGIVLFILLQVNVI